MDARITKKRLSQMLSYDWIKILACIVAGIFLWSLIFTTTAARLNPAQTFTVYAYIGTNPTGEFSSKVTSRSALSGGFSYDVIETSVVDLTTAGNQAYTLLEARMGVQEGNAAFVAPLGEEISDGNGGTITRTYAQDLLLRAYSSVLSFGSSGENAGSTSKTSFFAATENFLNNYYAEGYENAESFDAEKVKTTFRNRIKAQKDKRYKSEAKIREGEQDEIARIQGYRENYLAVKGYLEEGIIKLEETTITLSYSGREEEVTGYFGINLCPDERMSNLKELICYQASDGSYTAQDMQLMLLNLLSGKYSEYSYCLYESYAFIRKIVETYRSDV